MTLYFHFIANIWQLSRGSDNQSYFYTFWLDGNRLNYVYISSAMVRILTTIEIVTAMHSIESDWHEVQKPLFVFVVVAISTITLEICDILCCYYFFNIFTHQINRTQYEICMSLCANPWIDVFFSLSVVVIFDGQFQRTNYAITYKMFSFYPSYHGPLSETIKLYISNMYAVKCRRIKYEMRETFVFKVITDGEGVDG